MHIGHKDLRTCLMILIALSITMAGCAFGTRQAILRYPPQSEAGVIPNAQAATTPQPKKTEIVLANFNDQRQDKRLIGTVRNGFGMRTADVVSTSSVPEWMSEAVKNELSKSG